MIGLSLVPRDEPLAIAGVFAEGAVARALVQRVLAEDEALLPHSGSPLRGVASVDAIVLLGEAAAELWVDGVVYIGAEPSAPVLYLPTHAKTQSPSRLVARALTRRAPPPWLYTGSKLYPLGDALPLSRTLLEQFLRVTSVSSTSATGTSATGTSTTGT